MPTRTPKTRPPWEGVAAVDLLRRKAPDATIGQHRERFVALLREAYEASPRAADVAARLEVPHRTLNHWLAALRARHPEIYATLPVLAEGRRPAPKGTPQDLA